MATHIDTEVPTTTVEESIAVGTTVTGVGTIIDHNSRKDPATRRGIVYPSNMKAAPSLFCFRLVGRGQRRDPFQRTTQFFFFILGQRGFEYLGFADEWFEPIQDLVRR